MKYEYKPGVLFREDKYYFFLWRISTDGKCSSFNGTDWIDKTVRFQEAEFIEISSGACEEIQKMINDKYLGCGNYEIRNE